MEIRECEKILWEKFRKYHYLNTNLLSAAKNYLATIDDHPVGFISITKFVHPIVKNMYKVYRLVVLPDYQGIGIGSRLLDYIAEKYYNEYRFSIVTSTPALIFGLKKNPKWKCVRVGRVGKIGSTSLFQDKEEKHFGSSKRITASFEYNPKQNGS